MGLDAVDLRFYAAQSWYRHRRRFYARLEDETHVDTIPEVEPNDDHGTTPYGCVDRIKRFDEEVYVDEESTTNAHAPRV